MADFACDLWMLLSTYIAFYVIATCVNLFVHLFPFPPTDLEVR